MAEEIKDCSELLQSQQQRLSRLYMQDTVALLTARREKLGDEVLTVAEQYTGDGMRRHFAEMASRHGSNSIADLIQLLWEPMLARGQEYTMEARDGGVQIRCTKCYLQEWAAEWGAPEVAYRLTCSTDPYIVEGFNPKIGFRRDKTLMEGHDCCNHFYYLKEE